MFGMWIIPAFFMPIYDLLGIIGISISVYLVYTLDQQSEADNADAVDSEGQSSSTPIETLRQRYAAGDISQTEFERQMEQLLKTEDLSQTDQLMSLLQNNKDTSHVVTESSSELTEEEGY
jgi:Predicted membrane protein